MKEIQEYREATAKALGADFKYAHGLIDINGVIYRTDDISIYAYPNYPLWCPVRDANQMLMVAKHLQKKGIFIECYWGEDEGRVDNCVIIDGHHKYNENILIAFMKAFLEYIKTK